MIQLTKDDSKMYKFYFKIKSEKKNFLTWREDVNISRLGAHAPHGGSTDTKREEGGAWGPRLPQGFESVFESDSGPPSSGQTWSHENKREGLSARFSLNLKRNSIENLSEIPQIQSRHCCHSTISL